MARIRYIRIQIGFPTNQVSIIYILVGLGQNIQVTEGGYQRR